MAEQTKVKADGTQVTKRTPPVVPNLDEPCQAIVTTQVVLCEPMSNGTWQLLSAFNDNYNMVLEHREAEAARLEVLSGIMEIKEKWNREKRIISLENLLTIGRPSSSKTEKNDISSAQTVEKT
jgi:hypothetical protein